MKFKTLQDDLTFKYVFSHHEILKDLIDSFLKYMNIRNEVTFTNIKIQDYMLPNKQTIKGFFGDIVVTLDNGYILSIEMYKSIFSKSYVKLYD